MAKKIDKKLNGVDIVDKEFGDFLDNGGTIGGIIKSNKALEVKSTTHNESVRLLMESGQVALRHYVGDSQASNLFVSDVNDKSTLFYGDVNILNGFSKTTNGYTKLPNGFILQWGSVTVNATQGATVMFPIQFPSGQNPIVTFNIQTGDSSWAGSLVGHIGVINSNAFNVFTSNLVVVNWMAIGY